jgi:antitoxin VapB
MKTAKIFANGRSRAVRIPSEWLKGADEVELLREGDRVVITPIRPTLGQLAKSFREDPIKITRKVQTKTPPRTIGL